VEDAELTEPLVSEEVCRARQRSEIPGLRQIVCRLELQQRTVGVRSEDIGLLSGRADARLGKRISVRVCHCWSCRMSGPWSHI
jgi:hypothetical protein